jgi:ADP-heptose:LPS heptosyltransferase
MILKKERLGWSFAGKYYRLRKPWLIIALYFIDLVGSLLFILKNRTTPKKIISILVIQLDHIGDMILCTPLIENIRRTYPEAKLSLLIRKLADPIAQAIPGVDEILYLHTPWLSREKSVGWAGVLSFCFHRFRKYDCSFEVHGEPRNILISFLLSKFRVGLGLRGFGFLLNKNVKWEKEYSTHIIGIQARLLNAVAGKNITPSKPSITIPLQAKTNIDALLSARNLLPHSFLMFQMSTGAKNREWPLSYWKQLSLSLVNNGYKLVCADMDKAKTDELKSDKIIASNIEFLSLSLMEYSALIQQARGILCVETFANHLASCFNTPALALYSGVTFKEEWGPYFEKKTILQNTSCSLFPCALKICPFGFPSPCMKAITVQSVADNLSALLRIF